MLSWLVWFPLKLLRWALCAVGVAALLVTAMVATPLPNLPELRSVSETARAVDRSTMPALDRFTARDGTQLAYRHYPARGPANDRIAILIHGSSGSSTSVHALADALAARGVETYAPDIRGHGGSGTRGDIAYLGQLEDDLADLVTIVRKTSPNAALTLLGHSAGGGFALRVAGSPMQDLFARTVLIAPYLGYDAPTNWPHAGGWAGADVPRALGLMALRKIGLDCCEVVADAGVRRATELGNQPDAGLFVSPDAQFRDPRVQRRSRGGKEADHAILWRRRRNDAREQICRRDPCRRARGRRQADRGRQSHGDRQRAEGRVSHRRRRRDAGSAGVMIDSSRPAKRCWRSAMSRIAFASRSSTTSPAR